VIDFHSYLTELFDKPFPVREMKRIGYGITTVEVTYQAQIENGQYLNIDITKINQGWEINFTLDGSHELTHAGKPYRILATVVEAVQMFLKWHTETFEQLPKQFDMISKTSEGKRDAVYSAMMRRFGKQYGYKIANTEVYGRGSLSDKRTVTTAKLAEDRDYKAEYAKMYGGANPTPKQRIAMKKKTSRKRILRKMGREGKSNDGKEIDHKDGNALNNGKKNIRLVTRATNRSKDNNKWRRGMSEGVEHGDIPRPKKEYYARPFNISGKIVELYPVYGVPVKSMKNFNAPKTVRVNGKDFTPSSSKDSPYWKDSAKVWRWRVRIQTTEGWMLMGYIGSVKAKEELPKILLGDTAFIENLILSVVVGGVRTQYDRNANKEVDVPMDYRANRYDRQLHGKVKRQSL
jgi:GMP synthase-like glutamine amidotransferase